MSRKYQGHGKKKKARGVGSVSHSKHRSSGGPGQIARWQREQVAKDKDEQKKRRRLLSKMAETVAELMKLK